MRNRLFGVPISLLIAFILLGLPVLLALAYWSWLHTPLPREVYNPSLTLAQSRGRGVFLERLGLSSNPVEIDGQLVPSGDVWLEQIRTPYTDPTVPQVDLYLCFTLDDPQMLFSTVRVTEFPSALCGLASQTFFPVCYSIRLPLGSSPPFTLEFVKEGETGNRVVGKVRVDRLNLRQK